MKKTALKTNLALSIAGALISGYALILSTYRVFSLVCLLIFILVFVVSILGLKSKEIGEDELDIIHKTVGK